MTSRPRRFLPSSRRLVLCVAASCGAVGAQAADWRHALVQSVTVASAVDPAVTADCLQGGDPDGRVVVVVYRVGKSHVVRALPIAATDAFAAHDEVLVDPGACRIAALPKAASQP